MLGDITAVVGTGRVKFACTFVVVGNVDGPAVGTPTALAAAVPGSGSPFGAFLNAAGGALLLEDTEAVACLPALAPGAFAPPASAGATLNAEARRALLKSV